MVMVPPRDLARYKGARTNEFASMEQFLEEGCQQGISSINYGNAHLDLLIEDRHCETTVVIFHTALDPEAVTTPVFVGQGLMKGVSANVICCSDPALELGVGLGWFIGAEGMDFQSDLTRALEHVLKSFDSHRNLVFYGPSGGGFAALYFSSRFPGSLAMPVNPQTDIDAYSEDAVVRYCKTAWGTSTGKDTSAVTDLNVVYAGDFKNYVLYLQNLGDRAHIDKQLIPFLTSVSNRQKMLLSFGKWGLGHRAPRLDVQRPFIEAAVKVDGHWERLRSLIEISDESDPKKIKNAATEYTLLEKRALLRGRSGKH